MRQADITRPEIRVWRDILNIQMHLYVSYMTKLTRTGTSTYRPCCFLTEQAHMMPRDTPHFSSSTAENPMQKKVKPENFVKEITKRLNKAFGKARKLQKAAASKNKSRKPPQFKPNFKPGNLLLLLARSAREGSLKRKDEDGKDIPIPEKIRYKDTGPIKTLRWALRNRDKTGGARAQSEKTCETSRVG